MNNNKVGQRLVAHRGFNAIYPENTVLAIETALTLGARFVEVDVHLTADNIPIVIHDANLQRTAGIAVNVTEQTFGQLRQYSVHEPKRFGERYLPQAIPALQDVAALFRRYPESTLFIEAKRASITQFGVDVFLNALEPVVETIQDQCVLISFDERILVAAKQHQLCPVGWVFENWSGDPLGILERLQPDYVFTDYTEVPENLECLPHGTWKWAVYTIDDSELALQWFNKGAALVETNNFGALIEHPLFKTNG